jgi:hypothetical protein
MFEVGETVTYTHYEKARPCVILLIDHERERAVIAIGSTQRKDRLGVVVKGGSSEAQRMSLQYTTYFYDTKIAAVSLQLLHPAYRASSCPPEVLVRLKHLMHAARDEGLLTNWRFGDQRHADRPHEAKPGLRASLGAILRAHWKKDRT